MLLNVAEPKLASVGCAEPTAVGSSSIHSAEAAGTRVGEVRQRMSSTPVLTSVIVRLQVFRPVFVIDALIWSPGETTLLK